MKQYNRAYVHTVNKQGRVLTNNTLILKVDWPSLSRELAAHTEARSCPGAIEGMEILNLTLYKIGQLAVKTDNAELLELLEIIGVVHK